MKEKVTNPSVTRMTLQIFDIFPIIKNLNEKIKTISEFIPLKVYVAWYSFFCHPKNTPINHNVALSDMFF